jgi:hypothetical protein
MTVPNTTYRVLVEKLGDSDPSQFVGNEGEVFYDPNNPALKLSDGATAGGVSIGGTGGSNTISGIDTTGTSYFNDVQVSGVSVLGNTIVGGGTTELLVNGDVRIVGILTIGTSSITLDGSTNTVSVGSGITFDGTEGTINVGAGITLDATTGTINVSSISIDGQEAANIGFSDVLQLQGPLTNQVIFSFDGTQSNSANVFVNVGNSTSPGVYLANYNIAYTGDIAVLSEPYGVANAWIGVGSTPSFNINNNSGIVELRINLDSPSSVNVIVESKLYSSGITSVTPEPEESPYTITITSQPSDITLVEDNQDFPEVGRLSVTANVTGPEDELDLPQIFYQWEISNDGGLNWTTMFTDGAYFGVYHEETSSSELNIYTFDTSGDGHQYRCVLTLDIDENPYAGPTVISDSVTLTVVDATLSITSNPSNQTVLEGDFALFEVSATTNQDNQGLLYQWYGSSDAGENWIELDDIGSYFGTTTETLEVVATMDINGYQYRCFVTTGAQFVQPSATSTAATLTVIPEEE